MNWCVYILLCDNKYYYVGLTSNINNRLLSHKGKQNISTKKFNTIKLIYKENYSTRKLAEEREKQLKGWSIAKNKALIDGNILLLKLYWPLEWEN